MGLYDIHDDETLDEDAGLMLVDTMNEERAEAFRAGQEAMQAKVCAVIAKHYRGAKGLGGKTLLVQVKQDVRDIPVDTP